MSKPDRIGEYLETVQEQIRWKRARPVVAQELEQHLSDQRDAFLQEGKPPEEAERLAVADMGDPVTVGAELDAIHRPRPQWGLLLLAIALACAGTILRLGLTAGWRVPVPLGRSLLALALGSAALLGMYFLDVYRLIRYARWALPAALAAGILSILLSPKVAGVPYYARYVVLTYPVAYAVWLYSLRRKGWRGLALAVAGGALLTAVCLWIPYIQAALVLLITGCILLLCAIWQDWFGVSRKAAAAVVLALAAGVLARFAYLVIEGFGYMHLHIAFHPEDDPLGRGYQGMAVRRVLESARWLGEGSLDTGRLSFEYFLPNSASDMFPTTMIYRLGWLPYLLLLAALAGLLVWLTVRGLRQKHQAGRLIVLAAALTLGVQMLGSVVANGGIVLLSTRLPFVTGNLHTILDMALVGLALSVFRGQSIAREEAAAPWRRIRIRLKIEYV